MNFKMKDLKIEEIEVLGYEKVLKVDHPTTGLKGFISIHNRTLGPALGGLRIYPYPYINDALQDVLKLSKAMTYKSAIAQTGTGGGKSVIICDPTKKTSLLLYAFGCVIDQLNGAYIAAEDVGCTLEDCETIRRATPHVVGLQHQNGSGDPGPFTAWGVFLSIQSIFEKLDGSPSLEGKEIAIQGIGNVGKPLLEYLFWAGAKLKFSDWDHEKTREYKKYGTVVSPDEILFTPCDVLSPCALGGVINEETVYRLQCRAIVGAANNQLSGEEVGDLLRKKGILYAPDFVVNAGGLINVSCELYSPVYFAEQSRQKIKSIPQRLKHIFTLSEEKGISTHEAAVMYAQQILTKKGQFAEEVLCNS